MTCCLVSSCVVVCFGCEAIGFFFVKSKYIAIYLFIHTIQLTLTVSKLHPFCCVLPASSLKN